MIETNPHPETDDVGRGGPVARAVGIAFAVLFGVACWGLLACVLWVLGGWGMVLWTFGGAALVLAQLARRRRKR